MSLNNDREETASEHGYLQGRFLGYDTMWLKTDVWQNGCHYLEGHSVQALSGFVQGLFLYTAL